MKLEKKGWKKEKERKKVDDVSKRLAFNYGIYLNGRDQNT